MCGWQAVLEFRQRVGGASIPSAEPNSLPLPIMSYCSRNVTIFNGHHDDITSGMVIDHGYHDHDYGDDIKHYDHDVNDDDHHGHQDHDDDHHHS